MRNKIFTSEQVAEMLQMHHYTVLKYIRQGKLQASRIGRVYRIRENDIEKFLDNNVV